MQIQQQLTSMSKLKFLGFAIAMVSGAASAQTQVGPINIAQITTGWVADQFGIVVNAPAANPANCSNTDSYVVDSTTPGYKMYYAAALLAMATDKSIKVIVSNTACTVTRPTIIGVTIIR